MRSHDRSRFSGQDRHCRASANAPIDHSAASCSEPSAAILRGRSDLSDISIGMTQTISWIAEARSPTLSNIIKRKQTNGETKCDDFL